MVIGGIDTSLLPAQFDDYTPGQLLILDADGPAYRASANARTLATALKRFQTEILEQLFLTGSERASLHLTSSTCDKNGRFRIIGDKPYQGQRKSGIKPALLEPLRQAVALEQNWLPEYTATMQHLVEADDSMMCESYSTGDSGVMWSDDKDLRMTPHPYWDKDKGIIIRGHGFGSLYMKTTPSGLNKCLGYGKKFFWAQMLMGDSADWITGIRKLNGKNCGPAYAFEFLDPLQTETQVANQVISAYRKIDQNPIPEGYLLWLLRNPKDSFWLYLNELKWMPENRAFLDDCVRRKWFNKIAAPEPEYRE